MRTSTVSTIRLAQPLAIPQQEIGVHLPSDHPQGVVSRAAGGDRTPWLTWERQLYQVSRTFRI